MEQDSQLPSKDDGEPSVSLMRLQDAVVMAIVRARQRILQGLTVLSFVLLLLCVAAFLYGSFYYSYMPKATFSTPVHYYYRCDLTILLCLCVVVLIFLLLLLMLFPFFYSYRTDCESPASFSCSYPVANISLLRNKKHVGINSCRQKFNYTFYRHMCHIILGLFNY